MVSKGGRVSVLINEVEHIVGLSKKSIRYYESNGLLSPERNRDNDYRIYDLEDIDKLKKIKFLRELGVSINELKLLDNGHLTLDECLNEQLKKISLEEKKYEKIKNMCKEIINKKISLESIDIDEYFQKVNILGKEGFTMRDVKTSKSKKIIGAVLSSVVFSSFSIFLLAMISWFQFTEAEKMPWIMYFVIALILAVPIIGIVGNLISRIYEILGGEEDEASKY